MYGGRWQFLIPDLCPGSRRFEERVLFEEDRTRTIFKPNICGVGGAREFRIRPRPACMHFCQQPQPPGAHAHLCASRRPGVQATGRGDWGGEEERPREGTEREGFGAGSSDACLRENKVWLHQPCRSIFPLAHVSAGIRWGGAALTRSRRRSGTQQRWWW